MSFSSPPTPPDPNKTSETQYQYNLKTGIGNQELNMIDQSNPLGSMRYKQVGTNADGTPKYELDTQYSAGLQSILDNWLKATGSIGQTAGTLADNISGMYSKAPNLDINSTLSQLSKWNQDYNNPIFQQQQSNMDAKLRSQGITAGSAAYNNAQNLLARNQGDVTNQFFQQAEPLAYQQAVQTYQLPMQTLMQLMGLSQPTAPNFQSTPTTQIQPPNYQGMVQSNYEQQQKQYENQQAGMWGLVGTLGGSGLKALGQYYGGKG